jgi:hypothetical protein
MEIVTTTTPTAFEQDQDETLVLLEICLQTCMTYIIAECTVNKILMMDRATVRNM